MGLTLTALGMKWLSAWMLLLLFGFFGGLSATQAAVMAAVLAVLSWLFDRLLPFGLQGITRWAIDSGIAALTLYVGQFFLAGAGITLFAAVLAGAVIGAVEIPLHHFLAALFGVRRSEDNRDGIR